MHEFDKRLTVKSKSKKKTIDLSYDSRNNFNKYRNNKKIGGLAFT